MVQISSQYFVWLVVTALTCLALLTLDWAAKILIIEYLTAASPALPAMTGLWQTLVINNRLTIIALGVSAYLLTATIRF